MHQQFITTISLSIVLCVTLGIQLISFPKPRGYTAFCFYSVYWICGILITIFIFNMLWTIIFSRKKGRNNKSHVFWPNRRNTFRIIYPAHVRPKLIVEKIDEAERRPLEFSIVDLSQEGACFIDDGSLGDMKTFSGRIRFNNGDLLGISGHHIRTNDGNVSVKFHRTISWPTLLEEQRRVMVYSKPPQPVPS